MSNARRPIIWGNIGVFDWLGLGLLVFVLGLWLYEGVLDLVFGEDVVLGF